MPATAKTGSSVGTTTVSRVATQRGTPSRARDAKHGGQAERTSDARGGFGVARRDERGIGVHGDRQRLAQAAGRHRAIGEVLFSRDQQIHVARQRKMLKAVVQQVDGDAELLFGQTSREIPVGADEHRNGGQRASQHQRFVACRLNVREDGPPVRHDGDTVVRRRPAVAARQHRRTFTLLDEEPGNRRDDRRLAAAADAEVADAHDRLAQPSATRRVAAVPSATPRGGRAVEQARWVQSVNQSEGTNDAAARGRSARSPR